MKITLRTRLWLAWFVLRGELRSVQWSWPGSLVVEFSDRQSARIRKKGLR